MWQRDQGEGRAPRVLHCIESISSGGVERRHQLIIEKGLSQGGQHRVICAKASGPVAARLRDLGVSIVEVGPVRSLRATGRYRVAIREVQRWKPDIVHGAIFEGYTLAAIGGRVGRAPVVIMEETSQPTNRSTPAHAFCKILSMLADHCIGVSPAVGSYLAQTLHVPRRKTTVIMNGVAAPSRTPQEELVRIRRRLGLRATDFVVGSVGRVWDDYKRFSDLIRAFALLGGHDAKLLIVGSGPDLEALRQLADSLDLGPSVIFAGFQPNPWPFYALMNVFALASQREAFGLVIAEAMRAGLPVVATRVGGIPHVVRDQETGILVPPRQPATLATALKRVREDPELAMRYGSAGRELADRCFSAERYVEDVFALYRKLLARKRRGQRRGQVS